MNRKADGSPAAVIGGGPPIKLRIPFFPPCLICRRDRLYLFIIGFDMEGWQLWLCGMSNVNCARDNV